MPANAESDGRLFRLIRVNSRLADEVEGALRGVRSSSRELEGRGLAGEEGFEPSIS